MTGLIYRQNKPVYWSPSSGTALAEAELEYDENHVSNSAFIKFPILAVRSKELQKKIDAAIGNCTSRLSVVIWTTTPWTLPANQAVAVHSDLEYCIVQVGSQGSVNPENTALNADDLLIVGKSRISHLEKHFGTTLVPVLDSFMGSELAGNVVYQNPVLGNSLEDPSPIIAAEFVTEDSGTGLVHLAPGHGLDDYNACLKHGLVPHAPVDDNGLFTADALPSNPEFLEGKPVQTEGAKDILRFLQGATDLQTDNYVLATYKLTHKYPIDWRTKQPVIIRATEQWFANVDDIKTPTLSALKDVEFVPKRGRARLESFVTGRSQWCISRQRAWGVPIPALYRTEPASEELVNRGVKRVLKEAVMTSASIDHIMKVIQERGIDSWWSDPEDDPTWVLPGLEGSYVRGRDTMDVWFDSGTSWTLLQERESHPVADVYLEGSDQHRGWFQSSLLTHIACGHTKAPFKNLITHGFTLDEAGRKMSKSLGNTISPNQIIEGTLLPPLKLKKNKKKQNNTVVAQIDPNKPIYDAMGPDALRLWVASSDCTTDVVIGQTVLQSIHTALQKYRVTFKWLLGVLEDFEPSKTNQEPSQLLADNIALHQLSQTSQLVHGHYSNFSPYQAVGVLNRYVNANLSSFYFETLKDRLYTGDELDRHTAQAVAHKIFDELCLMLAPVTPVLIEEVWSFAPKWMQETQEHPAKRIWAPFQPPTESVEKQQGLEVKIDALMKVFDKVKIAQEKAREKKLIGSGLECDVILYVPQTVPSQALAELWNGDMESELSNLFVVSGCRVRGLSSYESLTSTEPETKENWAYEESWEVVVDGLVLEGKVVVKAAEGGKCARCWRYLAEENEELCGRCECVVH